jgi:phage repressor protein C with HTH and peptisase S24 domain
MNSDAFKSRLKIVMGGESNRSFADKCAISEGTLRRYLIGETFPSLDTLEVIAQAAGVNLAWLAAGVGPREIGAVDSDAQLAVDQTAEWNKSGDFVRVPRYEIAASAGAGAVVQSEQIVDYLAFKSDWLKLSLGLSPANAAVISVMGDSMEPYLFDGDLILVDTGISRISNDSVYVLQYDESLLVKRIQRKGDGTVIVKSDNPLYEPEIFRGDAADRLRVVGRLVRRLVR